MELTTLNMDLFYLDNSNQKWRISDIAEGKGFIEPDHLFVNEFLSAHGGIELTTNRIFTFLNTDDIEDLSFPCYFLMNTLLLTPENPVATLQLTSGSTLRCQLKNNQKLELEFLDPDGQVPTHKRSRYFNNMSIPYSLWTQETKAALDQLFAVLQRICSITKERIDDLHLYRQYKMLPVINPN